MKGIKLDGFNALQLSPAETVELMMLLFRVGFEEATPEDKKFAKVLMLRAAATFPEYADIPNRQPKSYGLKSSIINHRKRKK